MRRLAIGVMALAAACGPAGKEGQTAAPAGEDAAMQAFANGDLDAAERSLAGRTDDDAVLFRAKILLLRNRSREAVALLEPLFGRKADRFTAMEFQSRICGDLATAYVRLDDFARAAKVMEMMGESILAKKYERLGRGVAYASEFTADEAVLPFVVADPLPIVELSINGRRGNFTVDTGFDEILLDRDFAKRCAVDVFGVVGADAFKGSFDEAVVREVGLGRAAVVRHVPAHVGRAPKVGSIQADGTLGIQFLLHFDATLDYRRGRLILRKAGAESKGLPAAFAGDRHLLLPATVNGGSAKTFVGIGSGLGGVTLAASETFVAGIGEIADLTVGTIRYAKPAMDLRAFPAGLDGSYGFPVGFVLGHRALQGRVLRIEPRSLRVTLE